MSKLIMEKKEKWKMEKGGARKWRSKCEKARAVVVEVE